MRKQSLNLGRRHILRKQRLGHVYLLAFDLIQSLQRLLVREAIDLLHQRRGGSGHGDMQMQYADHTSVAIDGRHMAQVASAHSRDGMKQIIVFVYVEHRRTHDVLDAGDARYAVGQLARHVLLGDDSLDSTVTGADENARGRLLAHQTNQFVTRRRRRDDRRREVHMIAYDLAERRSA